MTRCHVSIECAGMIRQVKETAPDLDPKAEFNLKVFVFPRKSGDGSLVATFGSEEMIDVYGSTNVKVLD